MNGGPAEDPEAALRALAERHAAALEYQAAARLARGPDRQARAAVGRLAFRLAERAAAEATRLIPPPVPVACAPRCPWCCHIRLAATGPELDALAAHLRATRPAAVRDRLRRRLANLLPVVHGREAEARARQRLPCALLDDTGSCGAHATRPLACRAVLSLDVAACRAAWESRMATPVPHYRPPLVAVDALAAALAAALRETGLAAEEEELTAGLAGRLDV